MKISLRILRHSLLGVINGLTELAYVNPKYSVDLNNAIVLVRNAANSLAKIEDEL